MAKNRSIWDRDRSKGRNRPLRPANKADEWETAVLKDFENGVKERVELIGDKEDGIFRYMAPLMAQDACLKCHAKQGYRKGR